MHIGDMADELAEYELLTMNIDEVRKLALLELSKTWRHAAQRAPVSVVAAYNNLIGADSDGK